MTSWPADLQHTVDRQFDRLVALRRHFHQHPEPSGGELQTSFRVYQELGDRGFDVSLGPDGCGVVADFLPAGDSAGIFGFRADLDALQIQDEKNVTYRSQNPGIMHACGHDAHTTIVLGVLASIAELHKAGSLPFVPNIRGVFQPAEETCIGARQMIDIGVLDGVKAMLATHVDPTRSVRRIGLRSGVLTANCDEVTLTIAGRGGHAARPHEAIDPVSAAAQLINALYLQLSRSVDSLESVVFTVGTINGGTNANVIPDQVTLRGTLRTLDRDVRQVAIEHIERIASSIATGSQTTIEVAYGLSAHAVQNDATLIELLKSSATSMIGPDAVEPIPKPSMGSEDFAFFASEVPAAMFRLGCAPDERGSAGLHTSQFDIDEEAIRVGTLVMAHAALHWMEQQSGLSDTAEPTTEAV